MSDGTNPPTGPATDDEVYARAAESHRRHLASYNPDDPRSPVYKRPDLAAQYRERAEQEFADIMQRHGIVPPAPDTPEARAYRELDERYAPPPLSDSTGELIDAERERLEAVTDFGREQIIDGLKREIGAERYAELLAQAKRGLDPSEKWPVAVEASLPILRLLAAHASYGDAYAREKAALDARFKRS